MRNSFCIFFLLWVTLDVFSGEKCLFTIDSDFIVTDTISKSLSDTSRIFSLSDVVVKGSNIITKSDRLILIPTSNMQKASSSVEGTKRSVYLRENPKMVEEPRIEIVR